MNRGACLHVIPTTIMVVVFLSTPILSHASGTVTVPLFEAEGFYRSMAGPEVVTRTFTVPAAEGAFTLSLDNGSASGESLTSSAVVKVNGITVVKTSDLSQQVTHLLRDLAGIVYRGTNTLSVEVRSIPSSYVTIAIEGVYLLDVRVTDPEPFSSLDSDKTNVQGMWQAYTADVGIVVNGVPAALSGGVFVASDVPLVAGTNALTATITTFEKIKDTASVQVTASGEEPNLRLLSSIRSGIVPAEVRFSPSYEEIQPVEFRYDLDGNGTTDVVTSTANPVTFSYQSAGVYSPTLEVTDSQGQVFSAETFITLESFSSLDPLLTGRWDALSSALIHQDVSGAMTFILPEARGRHEGLLQAIKASLPALHASLPAPELARVEDDTAEYFIVRQQNLRGVMEEITHSIWFQRDSDGIWRIRNY